MLMFCQEFGEFFVKKDRMNFSMLITLKRHAALCHGCLYNLLRPVRWAITSKAAGQGDAPG